MKPTQPPTDAEANRDDASQKAAERSSAGDTGGAPAAEEDIGTEGAGTEPRESANVERERDPSSKGRGNKDGAV